MKNEIDQLLIDQLSVWETARNNYEALKQVKTKELDVNGAKFKVQFNPARIVSSGAKVDAKSIQERKCFLCAENRPKEQDGLVFKPKVPLGEFRELKKEYTILINPFPIFPKHFTIPDVEHVPQLILGRFSNMLDLAEKMDDYVIFYNGPKCGASAPDHVHFQAGNIGFLPIEKEWRNHISEKINDNLFAVNYGFSTFVINAPHPPKGGVNCKILANTLFEKIYKALPIKEGDTEPMMNILAWYEKASETPPSGGRGASSFVAVVIPRAKHRPDCYFAEGEKNILISPASVDLGGVFITPLEKDFGKISAENVAEILGEVCLDKKKFQEIIEKIR